MVNTKCNQGYGAGVGGF